MAVNVAIKKNLKQISVHLSVQSVCGKNMTNMLVASVYSKVLFGND